MQIDWMNWIEENWFVVSTGVYFLAMILYGHYRGFMRLAVTMLAFIATLVIVNIAKPYVTTFIKNQTGLEQMIEQGVLKASGIDKIPQSDLEAPSMQRLAIENLNLPEQIKQGLIENNNNEIYQMLGVDHFIDYVGDYLAQFFIDTIGFVVLFILVFLLIRLIMKWVDFVTRIPIISGVNHILGALLGGVQALLFFWMFCLLLNLCSNTEIGGDIMRQIRQSAWLTFLYNNNVLNYFIKGILLGIIR